MSTPDKYLLLVQDHTFLISLDDTYVFRSNNTTETPTGWEQNNCYLRREREPWMSVSTTISSGSSTSFTSTSTSNASIFSNFPPLKNFTNPFSPPPTTSTIITTIIPTTILTTRIRTTSTNFVLSTSFSTTTQPAAIATEATSALNATASLTHTNLIISAVLGGLTVLLLLLLIILFCLYTRRKRRQENDSDNESDRRMSVAAPGAMFISQEPPRPRRPLSLPRVSQAPLSMNIPLSSNPYGGRGGESSSAGPVSPPIQGLFGRPTRFERSASNPEPALWMPKPQPPPSAPTSPRMDTPIPFPRINIQRNTPSSSSTRVQQQRTSTSPVSSLTPTASPAPGGVGLERQPSLPLYHRALQEQATHQRERAASEEAGRLGIPVITGFHAVGQRGSMQSQESEFMYGHSVEGSLEGSEEDRGDRGEQKMEYDAGIEGSGEHGQRRGGKRREVLHSTRASSGVFPE